MSKNSEKSFLGEVLAQFEGITHEAEVFLSAQPEKWDDICELLQQVYRRAKSSDDENSHSAEMLDELVFGEMDAEQIWQQLEVRNSIVVPQLFAECAKLLAIPEENLEIRLDESDAEDLNEEAEAGSDTDEKLDDDEVQLEPESGSGEESSEDDDEDEDKEFAHLNKQQKKRHFRSSVVDDKFFKLGEMEAFLEAEDAKEMRKQKGKSLALDDDGIDYFADNFGDEDEEEDDENLNYQDFFDVDDEVSDKKGKKTTKFKDHFAENDETEVIEKEDEVLEAGKDEDYDKDSMEDDDNAPGSNENEDAKSKKYRAKVSSNRATNETEDMEPASDSDSDASEKSEHEEKPKSTFELRQERLQQRIRDYEAEVLGEKPWQLKGEIQATNRPQNSLLEEILEFESTVRPAPVITEETTRCLEDIIMQRIKDKAWDDVVAKVRPVQTPQEYRKQLVLDQEKSKVSLAQIYEKEYQQELDKLDPNRGDDANEEEPKEHKEIRRMMKELFVKLDALSNFHFTPKPVAPEAKIITNTPAVAMEEVAPVAVSDAKLLAPEEVYRGPKNELLGKSERNRTDKNRERRKKKNKQRAVNKAVEARDIKRQKLGIPLTKKEEGAKLLKTITKHRNVHKITASNDHSALKSSKSFFSKLQDTTTSASAAPKAQKRKPDAKTLSAKKLKL